ncbi:pogo transposable element with ZNF domain isoform X2 [Pseudorasbora parva]|uniref:pogo transposable element with ZNF domain isoform X2 n=1 Tax=Pseudorasbora parva TaxID=51549 RepID=UPI00351E92F5
MDADLFMECEEEELEPWQQQNSMDESVGNAESSTPTVSSTPATVVDIPAEPKTVLIPSLPPVINTANTVPLITNTLTQRMVPTDIPKAMQGQQLFLTSGGGGLGTVALSQVLLPGTSIGNATNSQPFYFTTQGLPVQNIQPGQSPMSLVLNVQQGQTVRPITLVQAPGTQIFKPAVGATQIITQPAQIRAGTQVANRVQAPSTFSTVQIPATLTIRTTTAVAPPAINSLATMSSTTITQPSTARTTTKIVTIKPGNGPLDMQNIMSLVKSVNLPGGAQAQTFVVMSNQKTNNGPIVSSAVPIMTQNVVQTIPVTHTTPSTISHLCPRCGAQFKMIEALRSHMCFCCPGLVQKPDTSSTATVVNTPATPPKSPSVVPSVKLDSPPTKAGDTPPRLVMLVDDFYYGTFEGNRVYVPMDNSKEPLSFKCLSCNKRLKNNVRLMNHMRYHVELEQQNGEMDTHTSCQHCFRRFPTPFRLQCHLESVHTAIESSTKCKICEWSFESEPVFLQHMKNTHKPGEMPYVCQVCEYRSSLYSDVFNHFRTWHEDTRHLLCQYCLKVFKHSTSYQQHYIRHQSTVYHCNKCRLQFLFTKDKVEHKINHHRTFRKPRELEGLQPGTKVTIRAYVGTKKSPGQASPKASSNFQKNSVSSLQTSGGDQQSQRHGSGKKQVSKTFDFLSKFQEQRALLGRHKCVECTFDIPDFANHYPTYVHCSLCFYSTCCSRAYANHMINNHVPGRVPKASKKGPPSGVKLSCAGCEYSTALGNMMAKHLIKFSNHSHCLFTRKECLETDIEFCQVEEEVEGPQGDEASDVGTQPDWLSMKQWILPKEEGTVPEFMDSCGPQHIMARNNDVLDYFQLLFPDILFEQIVFETNSYATYCCSLGQGDPSWNSVSIEEIKGFFGLSILMGLQGQVEPELYWSWDHHHGRYGSRICELFYRTMSVKRFKQISTHIRMSSMLVENDNQSADKLSFFQPMLSILQTSMRDAYRPNKCLTVDQAFLPSHEKGIAQEKSRNSQPRIWLLCDSKSGYCHKLLVLTRQDKNKDLGKSVVPQLIEGLEGKHHHIFLSSSLVSVPLMRELYDIGIYCSSSVLPQSPILPKEFWDEPPLNNPGDFRQYELAPLLATRWKDNKQLVCLSTNADAGQPDVVWRRSPTKIGELCAIERPQAFKLLQDNMRGVDICNQLLTCNQLGGLVLDTNWRRLFWFLVNLSIINSFIVLRETRKDNPPGWFQGGHFSQAVYRKRLGYQLAKCAERYARQNQVHDSMLEQQTVKKEKLETQEGVRHRLAKITRRTRRCKVCNLKNERHESIYGCTACRVNLCKRSCCFWDYHGFSPNYEGNAKVGFIDSKRDGTEPGLKYRTEMMERELHRSTVDVKTFSHGANASLDEDVDQEMAPLEEEDTDSVSETTESDEEVPHQTVAKQKLEGTVTNTLSQPVKNREETLSIHQRRILLLALCSGIQKAAKEMDTKPQLIKSWLQAKENQLNECSSRSCGEAVDRLVEWVLTQREQQRPISEAKLFEKASELQTQTNESGSFRISYEWAVSFMMEHKLGLDTSFTVHRELPNAMEENCRKFTELVHSQIKLNNVPQCAIGAMDQLSVFVDFNMLNEKTKISRETAFQFTGSGKPFVRIYLAMLANGTMLPATFFTSHATSILSRSSDSILLMAKEEGFSATEQLDVWATKVWKQHLDSQNENQALLVMDSHHSQTSENVITTISSSKAFLATVPSGCTGRHQPLEMCIRPVLQRLFLARWAQQPSDGASGVKSEDLVQLLVSWLEEAMSCFSARPEFIQHSFCLARLLPDQEAHTNLPHTPLELLNILSEAMLGPEVVDLESEEDEPMDTHTVDKVNQITEKIDLTLDQDDAENEVDQMKDENATAIEIKKTEQQKEKTDEYLEIESESTDFSHSSPESETPSHNSDQDNFSESVLQPSACQTDSANR